MKQRFRFLLSLFFAAPLSLSLSLSLCTFSACFWCWCRCKYFRRRTRWLITAQSSSSIWKISRDGGLLVCFCFKRLWNGAILLWSSTLFVSHTHTHTHTHIHIYTHSYTYTLSLSFSLLLTAEIEGRIFDVFRVWCLIIDAVTDKMSDYGSSARPTESWKMPGDFQIVLLNDAANCCLNGAAPCERKHGHFC